MTPKPSKTLATIIAKGAIRAERNPHISLLNAVGLEMVAEHYCHASHIMRIALDHNDNSHIALRLKERSHLIDHIDHSAYSVDGGPLELLWQGLVAHYATSDAQNSQAVIHSGHLLHYLLSHPESHIGQIAAHYDLRPQLVELFNKDLPSEEEYYGEIAMFESAASLSQRIEC